MKKIVLASSSKTRQEAMDLIGFDYEIVTSKVEEKSEAKDPLEYVRDLSKDKAYSVKEQLKNKAIIIAADTVITLDNKIFEKPKTKEEAFNNIKNMIGKTSFNTTGITILDLYQNKMIQFNNVTEIKFRNNITDEEIKWYIDNEKDLFNRAGYAMLGKAILFIEKINGSYTNIAGLPMNDILNKMQELGYDLNEFKLK